MSTENTPSEKAKIEPDWKIRELYSCAWTILKKYKVLWLFGMAAAAGGYSSSSSSNFDSKNYEGIQNFFQNLQPSSQTDHSLVLGTSANALTDSITSIITSVNPSFYILLILEIILLICVSIIISVIFTCWGEAGLLQGIQDALTKETATIRASSEKAFSVLPQIIRVRIIPNILFFLFAFISTIILIIILNILGPIFTLVIFLWALFLFYSYLMINLSQIWAVRKIITEKISAKQALVDSHEIARKKFFSMLWLGILNILLGLIVVIIIFTPSTITLIYMLLTLHISTNYMIYSLIISTVTLLFLAFIVENIASGIIKAFTTITWSLAYQKIKGKYDK